MPDHAAPVSLFGPLALKAVLGGLVARITAAGGPTVETRWDLNPAVAERILAGERFDLGVTNPEHAEPLFAAGLADRTTHRPFAQVPLALARRGQGGPPPAETAEEIAALVKGADRIAYTGAGTSGRIFLEALARLGAPEAAARARAMGGGEPVAAAAAGDVDLAAAPLTTIIASPGVEPAAILPASLGAGIEMSMFLSVRPADGAQAGRLLDALADAAHDPWLLARGARRFAVP